MTSLYSITSQGKIFLQNSSDWVLFSYHCKFKKKSLVLSQGLFAPLTSLEHRSPSFSSSPVGLPQFSYKQQLPNDLPTFQVLRPSSLPLLQNQWDFFFHFKLNYVIRHLKPNQWLPMSLGKSLELCSIGFASFFTRLYPHPHTLPHTPTT